MPGEIFIRSSRECRPTAPQNQRKEDKMQEGGTKDDEIKMAVLSPDAFDLQHDHPRVLGNNQ